MRYTGMSIFTIIGIVLYLAIYLVDRFVFGMTDLLYTILLVVCLVFMIVGIIDKRKKN